MALDTIQVARAEIAKIYIAAFNRVPDAGGLSNWMNQYTAGLMTYAQIAENFTTQPEYAAKYPSIMTNTEYVTEIYNNVFGRSPDAGGLTNWVNQLDYTSITGINRGNIMTYMLESAGAAGNTDGERLDNQAAFAVQSILDGVPEATATAQLANITSDDATVTAATAAVAGSAGNVAGSTFNLVAAAENLSGTANNDIFNGSDTTSVLDVINGSTGNDTFNYADASAAGKDINALGLSLTSVEVINVRSTTAATATTTAWTDVVSVNVTQGTSATVAAATTTDVGVSGSTGAITVDGGKNVTVTDGVGVAVDVGQTTLNAGTVSVTTSKTNGIIAIDGGTDVTVKTTSTASNGAITVGDATTATASGNVAVTSNLNSDGVVANIVGAAINVVGGKTVNVTVNANSAAKAFDSNNDISTGTVTVTADKNTTDVTVTQNSNVTTVTKAAVALVGASQTVTFKDLANGETVTIDGLVFTASKDLTAAQVAAAFANLTASDTQSVGGVVGNGIYTVNSSASWTSGAASGATVTFTGAADNTATFAVASSAAASVPTKTYALGTAAAAAVTSTNAVTLGNVIVDDNATKSIETVTVDGATNVTLGGAAASGKDLNAITTLSLANVVGATALNTTATSLNLTVNDVATALNAAVVVDLDITAATITTLNLTSTGDASVLTLTAGAVKYLTVDAGAALTISGAGLSSVANSLETVTVKGTAAVNLATIAPSTSLKSFNASANTGGVTATISALAAASHADLTTFVFSEGNDVVTLSNLNIDKKINLGAGDDKITFAAGVTSLTKEIDGGTGSNTIVMTALQAETATAGVAFEANITNFQKLSMGATLANTAVNLANMDDISYVISAGTGAFTLGLTNMANNGTLELTGATNGVGDVTVTMTDATSLTADVFNIVTKVTTADITFAGDVVVAGVETINITATDSVLDDNSDGVIDSINDVVESASLIVTATEAKTVNVYGNSNLSLALTGSTAVTLIDGSTMTGALTATTAVSTAAATIKGGSGNDNLTADTNSDVLMGGAGNDTLIVSSGNLVQLYGGTGKDTYTIGATSNQNAYATINGTAAELSGDKITFSTALTGFTNAKIVLGDTSVFQDYVNEAAKGAGADGVSYFVWENNTYLVQDIDATVTFTNATDAIVKIAGVVDFTFNSTTNVLEIA